MPAASGYDYSSRQGTIIISWDRFAQLATVLAERIAALRIDAVIGNARAGLIPATFVACTLRKDLFPVRLTRRANDLVVRAEPSWVVDVSREIAGKRVAIVDEIASSGATLAKINVHAREAGAARVFTAALVSHSWADPAPDVTALVSDALVIFPWDRDVFEGGKWQMHPEYLDALQAMENANSQS